MKLESVYGFIVAPDDVITHRYFCLLSTGKSKKANKKSGLNEKKAGQPILFLKFSVNKNSHYHQI
ncbi:MAG: hypothetical protein ACJAT7_002039 [Psychromonas sp.]|jgi:hypothetical protein